jgi:50S ribosomal subunit-associated GTPase HflX
MFFPRADWRRIFIKIRRRRRRASPLKIELANLRAAMDRTDRLTEQLSAEFWANGGICCPTCGVPGYGELLQKQERRKKRAREIKEKLGLLPRPQTRKALCRPPRSE